ncbi:MAG TPA: hypothetical protein VFQ43_13105 [Nitrososphaera sp.]|nr:hypothetical protein [Nitrososphaera sp.]
MKPSRSFAALVLVTGTLALGQVQTDCRTSGDNTHCTSTDVGQQNAERDRQGYEMGQQMGKALGSAIALGVRGNYANRVRKYCKEHAGETYTYRDAQGTVLDSGTCPTHEQQVIGTKEYASFCWKNPDQYFKGVSCADAGEQSKKVAEKWTYDHPKYHQSEDNAKIFVGYMQQNDLNPLIYENYDKAFKGLSGRNSRDQ